MKDPVLFSDADKLVDFVIDQVGTELVLGMQLGLGKPNNIANAIYQRVKNDPKLKLRIITGLSLETPTWSSELERRFMAPLIERVWGGYVNLEYATDVRLKRIPENVEVSEFFYKAGAFLGNPHMQQNYISSNYTHAARDVNLNGMNVAGALLGKKELDGNLRYSVGCNGDTAVDALDILNRKRTNGFKGVAVGEVNENLPFMYGDAVVDPVEFDAVLEGPQSNYTLFGAPKEPVNTTDYMIGIHASALIPDDGTLQIGIGSLGDAITYGLVVRQKHNDLYKKLLDDTGVVKRYGDLIQNIGGTDVFEKGLYGCTEMLVDTFLDLYEAGIMKRRVYDDIRIQKVVSEGLCPEDKKVTPEAFRKIIENGDVRDTICAADLAYLQKYGVVKDSVVLEDGQLKDGATVVSADMTDPANVEAVSAGMLGETLKEGYWIHGGFYLGPQKLYDTLNKMGEEERAEINMTSVLNVNQLYSNNKYNSEALKLLQRKNARFINAGLMATLNGAIASDGLEDGRVVSGIGGQYNFVAQGHILEDARGAIMIRSTRGEGEKLVSNVVFNYGHCSVPRHLRDIVITEYGIADVRGKSDKNVIKELLNVADSRFQEQLLAQAKKAGKIEADYRIPDTFRNNYPEKLEKQLKSFREKQLFPVFPFGTAFTDEEITIGKALKTFKAKADSSKFAVAKGLISEFVGDIPAAAKPYLERMNLDRPADFKEKLLQKIVLSALKDTAAI